MTIVPAEGYFSAKYVLVGARPGKDEVPLGRPFMGPSGQLLNKVLPFPRHDCYITNVRKDYSATHSVPTLNEIHEALPSLKEELSKTKANIIIALGGEALYALTGMSGIEKYRGSVLPSSLVPGRKVIGTYHPAACLHTYQWSYILQRDLRRAIRESGFNDIRRRGRTFVINPSLDQAIDIIEKWGNPISVDIETFGNVPDCVGVGDSPDNATCFPFIGGNYNANEMRVLWRVLGKALEDRDIIGQNIQFDITRLERFGFRLPRIYFDTMLAHHLLWPELGGASKRADKNAGVDSLAGKHSLAFLTSMYTDEPYYKDEGGFHGDFPRRWNYNCKDVSYTYECYEGLLKELKAHNQWDYYRDHILALIRPVMGMQSRGFCIDFGSLNKTRNRMELEVEYLQLSLNQTLGFACNVKSPIDIRYLIQDILKLQITKRTKKTNKPAIDEDTIRTLAYNSPHADIFQRILDIRERRTMLSGFLGLETDPEDGRYKVNFLIHGTDSSRLSSRAARKGPQLQNIPYAARSVFKAGQGNVLVQGDLAKADATYVAYDSQSTNLIDMLSDPTRNMYVEVGSDILGRQFTKEDLEYKCFKSSVHAAHYGMGPHKWLIVLRLAGIDINDILIRGITKPLKKAEYFLETYHAKNPSIRHRWQRGITEAVKKARTLHDSFDRIRIFLGRMDDYLFRKAFAYRPRSTVGGITNRGLRLLHDQGYQIVNQVHDSIAIEIEQERETEGVLAVQKAMECPLDLHGRTMTIRVDIQTGPVWGRMTDWKGDPDGGSGELLRSIHEVHGTAGESKVVSSMGGNNHSGLSNGEKVLY